MKSSSSPKLAVCVAASILLAATAPAQTTTWTGATDNDFNTAGNWDNGLPNGSNTAIINSGTPVIDASLPISTPIIQNGGDVSATAAANTYNWDVLGGTVALPGLANGAYRIIGSTMTFDGGTLVGDASAEASSGFEIRTGSTLQFLSGVHDPSDGLTDGKMHNQEGTFLLDNASLSAASLWTGNFAGGIQSTTNTLQNGATLTVAQLRAVDTSGTTINIGAGVNTLTANSLFGSFGTNVFDITGGAAAAGSSITLSGVANTFWTDAYTSGSLLFEGDNTNPFANFFQLSGTDNETLTVVPEPGTYALLVGCLALTGVMLRRRRV